MSRSNPSEHLSNPATRWFEWNGEQGIVRYYDKEAKANVDIGSDFTFMLLDELSTVKGWHDPSQSGIYANEVKDTSHDTLLVKAFKAPGPLAEGVYREIKDRVNTAGGRFHASCYIAFKNGHDDLSIGNLRLRGAALGAWMEFRKAHRAELYEQAIRINGSTEGKKGRIIFHVPNFSIQRVSKESHQQAAGLDVELQTYLKAYFRKNTKERVMPAPPDEYETPPDDYDPGQPSHDVMDSEIPF